MGTQPVKKLRGTSRSGAGFEANPQNINREGRPETPWQWREIFLVEVEKDSEKRERMKKKVSMALAQIEKAESGDTQAFREIADRMEGRPMQKNETDLTSKGEKLIDENTIVQAIISALK